MRHHRSINSLDVYAKLVYILKTNIIELIHQKD